ncbi:MAG: hypothetical protein HKO65_08540 [Gemmatimonadetes bacterium]|nr:hypothetical protein [Gemmatimonadota bacterium]
MKGLLPIVPVLLSLFATVSCDGLLGPDEDRRVGVIAFYQQPVTIGVPDTVQLGERFEVSVLTYGGGCLSEGETKIRVRGLQVDVTPFDIHSGARACTDDLRFFPHQTTVALPTPGLARFLFHGKQEPDGLRITVGRDVYVESRKSLTSINGFGYSDPTPGFTRRPVWWIAAFSEMWMIPIP